MSDGYLPHWVKNIERRVLLLESLYVGADGGSSPVVRVDLVSDALKSKEEDTDMQAVVAEQDERNRALKLIEAYFHGELNLILPSDLIRAVREGRHSKHGPQTDRQEDS